MSVSVQQIIEKYQGSAPQRVISAVEKAAQRTGADFSLLMDKAAAESSFNPAAKAKTSSATGLFQFIESTWLTMVKEHGHKYGLGAYANQIEMKNGKPCVENCNVKESILNLRKNPEISALMAGELSAADRDYLEARTDGTVGKTEMYLAHFLGAGSAAKFLNARDRHGNADAATFFPKEARANKSIFFDRRGHARSFDQIYDIFSRKIGDTSALAKNDTTGTPSLPSENGSATTAPAHFAPSLLTQSMPLMHSIVAQAQPLSGGIVWNDDVGAERSGFSHTALFTNTKLSAENMMVLAQMQNHVTESGLRETRKDNNRPHYNS